MGKLRVVSWNLANRIGDSARREGDFLADLDPAPDIVMLQEVNRSSADLVCERAGLDWLKLAVDIRERQIDDTAVRQRGVALAGRGTAPTNLGIIDDAPLPERTIYGSVTVAGIDVTIASYWAPPGVNWFEKKPQQAVLFAKWLARMDGPVIFGADANTPEIDHPDFALMRTHWHTGDRQLQGEPGDDLLWGPAKLHGLQDTLRRWFDEHPDELKELRRVRPAGPLVTSHRTGKRELSPGTDRRFDSIWVTDDFAVEAVAYPYEGSVAAGSDHSAVIADISLTDHGLLDARSSNAAQRVGGALIGLTGGAEMRATSPDTAHSERSPETGGSEGNVMAKAVLVRMHRRQALVEMPVATLDTAGVSEVDRETVSDPGFRGGAVTIRLGAAAYRYLGDTCGIGQDPQHWPTGLPDDAATMIAKGIPYAAEWIRYDHDEEKAVYSGDLARGHGDDPALVAKRYRATAASARLTSPPSRGSDTAG